jgi:AmmeMemoRadiSam system protein A
VTDDQGRTLLRLARGAIEGALGLESPEVRQEAWLKQTGAAFVTLRVKGRLRGCIGSVEGRRSLWADVRENAVAAALRDDRFPPVRRSEVGELEIEVSVCSPLTELAFGTEAEALGQLRPGLDGVVLEYGAARSTFLPQVWEKVPGRERFLSELKRKAGLPPRFWSADLRLYRYTVASWAERELDRRGAGAA